MTALAVGCCSSGCSSDEANATPRFIVALPAVVPAVVAVLWVVLWVVVAVLFLRLLLLRILRRPMPLSMM